MEVDQRDRERKWNTLLNPPEQRISQELAAKSVSQGTESVRWLDSQFPNLKGASDFQVQPSQLDPEFRRLMHIEDNEAIFLIFPAVTEKTDGEFQQSPNSSSTSTAAVTYKGQVWFTTGKFVAVRSDAAGLLFYSIALSTVKLGKSEETHIRETIQKWLKAVREGKTSTNALFSTFAYETISDVSVSNLGNPKRIGDVSFKSAAIPSGTYRVTFGRPVIPERVWLASSFERGPVPVIFCKPYPMKDAVQEMLLERLQAVRDDEGRAILSSAVQVKLFIDALRRCV